METNPCDMNQLDSDSHLPPRKRLLAGFKKFNSNGINGSSPSDFASSSSTSNSNGSSSASTNVQTHLGNLLSSPFNNDQSPEELVEATRSAAALAVKAAKAARAIANEKALISAKAIAAAKRALELVDSFPKEAMADCKERSPRKNKQKKHVPVELLYSKGQLRDEEDDLARRLHRAIDNTSYPRVLRTSEENGQRYKKQKKNKSVVEGGSSSIIVTGSMKDIAGVVDSDSSYEGLEIARSNRDEADSMLMMEKSGEESNSLVKRRGRVKLKKLPLSICNSRNQENGTSSASPLPVAQPQEDGGAITVIAGSSSWKCQDIKAPECVKQNKAVRS
ncbi:putative protein [Arabidopsis thaliana]|uniref:PHD finger-like protein n=2 Tax=Arabidopsis thaliana TaxID=3702 RepID=O81784_ARATH|nr:PHD finger-like protein [Arabidopsis thaliana]AEE86524.1 PHD finger-like protein [Arabidopsis thaliana]CAA20021.1 putative protein [Arabidopsis thaliana]CAB80267.1 putative protein [Arabidopsis thaliana]|eukprot:NP_195276.3 PHD finger-like protein [Arabidopsis thaliana]